MKHCKNKECNVELVVGENWYAGSAKNYKYLCKSCEYMTTKKWRENNPEKNKLLRIKNTLYQRNNPEKIKIKNKKANNKEGIGVYQVMLNSICLYVGEGQLYGRKFCHLKGTSPGTSNVYKYCSKHNINRKLLSFNVLEYEDDKQRRLELEDWYITFLMPVINTKPTLGLYV
tara:strand:- start:84 stop:599 length:516 start_codon:yes stop_codon:yes gene_type:complete